MRLVVFVIAGSLAVPVQVFAQAAENANKRYQTKESRAGIAKSLGNPHRDVRQKPAELVAKLGLKPGDTVVDMGTGVGYMLAHLSKAVGPSGLVYGEDIFLDFLEEAKERAKTEKLDNVRFITGSVRTPNIPAGVADMVMTLDAYHHFDYPAEMLAGVHKGLKADGKLVIIDFYKRPTAMPGGNAVEHIRIDRDDVVKEVEANGFRLLSTSEHIPESQYIAVFSKR